MTDKEIDAQDRLHNWIYHETKQSFVYTGKSTWHNCWWFIYYCLKDRSWH